MVSPIDRSVAAVDLGASSGRVVVGQLESGRLTARVVHRFANRPVTVAGMLHWNLLALWSELVNGLSSAAQQGPSLLSVGVDAWGVDYGLLRGDRILGAPVHYRDSRTLRVIDEVHARMPHPRQFARAGTQFMPMNTIYQFASDGEMLGIADTALLIPDLITWMLSDSRVSERSIASTTGLMGLSGDWDAQLLDVASVKPAQLAPVVAAGTSSSPLRSDVMHQIGAAQGVEVVTVAAHDTASAVLAAPLSSSSSAFISCGTWGLVGFETGSALTDERALEAGFTNEAGADGSFLFMKNAMGLLILTEALRQWEREGTACDLEEVLRAAGGVTREFEPFDVEDVSLQRGDPVGAIRTWYRTRGLDAPQSRPEIVRAVVESLAHAYVSAIRAAERLLDVSTDVIHLVGGGSRNALLCQSVANRSGLVVFAGPSEASAIGNILVQARSGGLLDGDVADLRQLVWRSFPPLQFDPR